MVYLGLLPEGIFHHGRKAITTGSFLCGFTVNQHPRITDKNSTVGILYSLSLMYLLRSLLLGTKHFTESYLSGSKYFIVFNILLSRLILLISF